MKISAIIPTYNEARNIASTVRHLRQYGGNHLLEVIVADGGSHDDTLRLAVEAGAIALRSPQQGRAAQMDFAARQSRGDILYFVHADTLPPPTYATDINGAVGLGWQMGNFRYRFDSSSWLLRFNAYSTRYRWFFTQGGDRTFFIQRAAYEALGGFDPNCVFMEDYEFLRHALRSGQDFTVLPAHCLVSARKYERNSWLRVQLANLVAYQLWARGWMRPEKIKTLYKWMLNSEQTNEVSQPS